MEAKKDFEKLNAEGIAAANAKRQAELDKAEALRQKAKTDGIAAQAEAERLAVDVTVYN